jgi:hypothetical protein
MKEDKTNGTCSTHGIDRYAYTILVGKLEEKGQLRKYRCTWEDTIKMYLTGTWCTIGCNKDSVPWN